MKIVPAHLVKRRGPGRPSYAESLLIDWESLQRMWEGGFSTAEICRRYPVSKKGVEYRAKKWDREKRRAALATRAKTASVPKDADLTGLPEPQVIVELNADSFMSMMLNTVEPKWPEKTFPLEDVARALEAMTRGLTFGLACESVGLSFEAVRKWREAEPRLDMLFRRARALAAKGLVEKVSVMAGRDWRAGAWLLERGSSKEEWSDTQQQSGLVIEVKVDRGEDVMRDAGIKIIDIEPSDQPARVEYQEIKDADMDPGLHTISETEGVSRPNGPAGPLRGSRRRG